MSNKQLIYTVDALCGAGKTHSGIQEAIRLAADGERIAIIQPTLDLSAQSMTTCRSEAIGQDIRITKINGDGTDSVKEAVKVHLSTPSGPGEILFITHSAWSLVCGDGWPNKANWHLIIDELPSVDAHYCENVPDNHHVFTSLLRTGAKNASGYAQLSPLPTAGARVEEVALNRRRDRVSNVFQELATRLVSPHWEVWVDDEAYKTLLAGGKEQQLNASAILMPTIMDGFKSVTVMGALFTDTNMCVLWSGMGVSFVDHPTIPHRLQYTAHANGRCIDIRYMYDAIYSKRQDEKHDLFGLMAGAVMRETDVDEEFLWLANKCKSDNPFSAMNGQRRLPNTPHGQNGFDTYHKIAFMPALNQKPFHSAFLKSLGFDEDGLQRALALQSTYQACMRTSIRNPSSKEQKTIYVFSKQIATWLQQIFARSRVTQIPGLPHIAFKKTGRPPKKPKSKDEIREDRNERQRKRRARQKAEKGR